MKKLFYLLALIPLMIGCAPGPSADIGSTCASLQPTLGDVQYILNFGSDLFTEAVWSRSYIVHEQEAIVSWTHRSAPALSDISMLMFCNDNGTADLELYYNKDSLLGKFANYDSVQVTASCKSEDLVLYEMDATEENAAYKIRQWFQPLNQTRMLSAVLVFPSEDPVQIEKYSQAFFPTLSVCQ